MIEWLYPKVLGALLGIGLAIILLLMVLAPLILDHMTKDD